MPNEQQLPHTVLTVGIPAYNAARSIEHAILSILRQTWRGTMEILVVDDGSTDETVAIATRLSQQYGAVRIVQHDRNHGRPAARNTVLRESRGDYLTWMDADDEWYPNKLAVQFDELLASAEAQAGKPVICMCAFDWKWAHSTRVSHRVPDVSGDQLKGLLNGRIGAYLWTMLARTESFRDVGEFDENLPRLQDLDFLIRFTARGGKLMVSDRQRPLCIYHKSDDDKPGRVIGSSLSHIWRKHYPLFRQYGRGFCRGSRRRHLLLASRHGFSNEGWHVGTAYYLWAAVASPGWLWAPLKRRLRPSPPERRVKLRTLRVEAAGFQPKQRSAGGPATVDVLFSLSKHHDGDLCACLQSWSDSVRAEGLLYVPPIGLSEGAVDHTGLINLLSADTPESLAAARRLLTVAVLSSTDGASSILYLGAPTELDRHSIATVRRGIARSVTLLTTIAQLLQEVGPAVKARLHLLVPDTETMLWRRYLSGVEAGSTTDFDEWLQCLSDADAAVLDHRAMKPLCELQGFSSVHVHVLAAGSRLPALINKFAQMAGLEATVVPTPAAVPLAGPSRNQGLVLTSRLLADYSDALGPERHRLARESLWRMPPSIEPQPGSAHARAWMEAHCELKSYEVRFAPAQSMVYLATVDSPVRVRAEEMVYPHADRGDFDRLAREMHLLGTAADMGFGHLPSPEVAK